MHLITKNIIACFFAITAACCCHAQVTGLRYFSISNPGANANFFSLKKYNKYFLAGTSNGLYRFDGKDFFQYPFAQTTISKSITAIGVDNNKVWLGFQSGEIGFLNSNNKIELLKLEEGYPRVAITSIVTDSIGNVYFSTAGEAIYYYRNRRLSYIDTSHGLSDMYVYDMMATPQGLVAATDRGVNIISIIKGKKIVKAYTSAQGLADNIVRCLSAKYLEKNENEIWIGMQDAGVSSYRVPGFTNESVLNSWNFGQVNSLLQVKNQLWAATEKDGIAMVTFSNAELTKVHSITSFTDHVSRSANLLQDGEGNIWFTANDRLVKTSGVQFQKIIPFDISTYEQVHAILADSKGNIWVNQNNGLRKYFFDTAKNRFDFKAVPLSSVNKTIDIISLYEDKFGHIWAGTLGRGIVLIDPETNKSRLLAEDSLLINGSILSINGKNDDVWITSLGGAVRCRLSLANENIFKPLSFQNFSKVGGIGSNYIYSTLVDKKKKVWFATDGRGISVLENGKFSNYNEKDGIKSLVIYDLCEDRLGNIWFSTLNGGLYRFDGNRFSNLSVEQGLSDATITSLNTDANGNVIAAGKNGINLINASTLSVSYADANNGLDELSTDPKSISTSKNGETFLVTSTGIIRYIPSYESLQPRIVLNNVQLFLNDVDITAKNIFDYDENNLSFSYTGISFSHPEKIRYQYKLEGFNSEWLSTHDNSLNYPKLPPGTYTFKVRASLNNQFEKADEVSYSFIITTPFWLRWWFIAACLVLLFAGVYFYIKNREKRLQRWDRVEKEKIQSQFETLKSQVNPHFLFNSFNTLISVIEENPGTAIEYVEHLSDLYRKIVTYRDKDVISLSEEIQLINDYFFIQKKRFGNNLQLNVNISDKQADTYLIAPLTLQLLCENAVKHNAISLETPLQINLHIKKECLEVINNINPKYTAEKGAGMGLQNIQKRYALLSHKEIKVENTGSLFIVKIPLLTTL